MKPDIRQVVGELLQRGAILEAVEGQLRFQAAPGVLGGAARQTLQERKSEVLALLGDAKAAVASYAQQRMWFLTGLAPETPVYNVPFVLDLRGPCQLGPLLRALREAWRRHESLRTRLEVWTEGPVQVVDRRPVPPAVVDLSAVPPRSGAIAEAERRIAAAARRPMDLAAGPLAQATVFRLSPEDHRVLVSVHHAVADAWSVNILTRELGLLYRAFAAGRPSPLPVSGPPYVELALQERSRYDAGDFEEGLRFWRRRLGALTPYVDLPRDGSAPTVPTQRGASIPVHLPAGLTAGLQQLARSEAASLFMVLLAAFQALLWRLSGQETFNVGTPVANRGRAEVEGVVGLLVNTLAVPADCAEEPSLREMVRRVRSVTTAGLDHAEVPFDLVVERVGAERGRGRQPLFSVLFNLQSLAGEPQAWEPLSARARLVLTGTAKADVVLDLGEQEDGIGGRWEYSSDLLDRTSVLRFAKAFVALVTEGLRAPDLPLSDVCLLDAAQRHQVLVEWNDYAPVPPHAAATVLDLVLARAREQPDRVAVETDEATLTFGALERAAGRWAHVLHAAGVGAGAIVAVLCHRSPALITAALAVFRAGAAFLPFDPATPPKRLRLMLEDAGASLLLSLRRFRVLIPRDWSDRTLFLDDGAVVRVPQAAGSPADPGPADLAYVIYTSGSTGRPKAVAVHHGGLAGLALWAGNHLGLAPGDRATLVASPAFDASILEVWPSLAWGCSLQGVDDETLGSPPRYARWLAERRVSVSFAPTPVMELLLTESAEMEPPLRVLYTGGDQLRRRPGRDLPVALVNLYGPTEVSVVSTAGRVSPGGSRLPSIGRPIAGIHGFVVDPRLRPVPAGVVGELCLGGAGVAHGYLRRAGLTAERFVPDPWGDGEGRRLYRTGDLVRWLPDGRLEFRGRLDQQVQIRGYRVEPGEVEKVLESHPAVRHAVVVPSERGGQKRLVAYVVAGGPEPLEVEELQRFLAHRLPEPMVPGQILTLDAIPMTPRGKVDRSRLPLPTRDAETAAKVAPRSVKEKILAVIWSRILGIDDIGAFDDFFGLGGTSLQMMQVISKVRETFDVDLPPSLFYRTSTLAAIAEYIRRAQKAPLLDAGISFSSAGAPTSPIVPLREGGGARPFLCVHSAGGHLVEYLELATELAAYGHSVYGVQAPALAAGQAPQPDRIEEMARGYVAAVRALHPGGPYRLLGYCAGSLIALEMAQQIREEGGEVDLLALVEPPPAQVRLPAESRLQAHALDAAVLFAGELKVQTTAEALTAKARRADDYPDALWTEFERQAPDQAERLDRETFGRLLGVYSAIVLAQRRYVVARYSGRISLFEVEPHRLSPLTLPSWRRVSPLPVDHQAIPGNHITCVRPPHVGTLAKRLHERLAAVDGGSLTVEDRGAGVA